MGSQILLTFDKQEKILPRFSALLLVSYVTSRHVTSRPLSRMMYGPACSAHVILSQSVVCEYHPRTYETVRLVKLGEDLARYWSFNCMSRRKMAC